MSESDSVWGFLIQAGMHNYFFFGGGAHYALFARYGLAGEAHLQSLIFSSIQFKVKLLYLKYGCRPCADVRMVLKDDKFCHFLKLPEGLRSALRT